MFAFEAFVIILLVVLIGEACLSQATTTTFTSTTTTTTSTLSKPLDNNKICQDWLGADYVWEENVQICVRCTSCTLEAQDPHCVTCRALGIIPYVETPSSGDSTPQLDVRSSTPFPPPSMLTTNSSPSVMSSTSQTNVTHDDNKGGEANGVVAFILSCLGVVLVVILILVWKFKYKIMVPTIYSLLFAPMKQPQQETGPPDEIHPMALLPTDVLENQAAEAV